MRMTGTIRSGPVILIRAMSTSIRALRWFSVPERMMSPMWSATCRRVAAGGAVGVAATWPASLSRRASSSGETIGPGLLRSILNQAGVTAEELRRVL
jgi:hypothetical protein